MTREAFEKELWLKAVDHCIKNDIHGFHFMFDEFLKMREGWRLVNVDALIKKWEAESKYREDISSEDFISNTLNECIDDLKAMIGGEG